MNNLPSWDPNWKRRYNSPPDNLINDFYIPAFARSSKYDRAVGFFSSHLLAAIAPSIDEFVLNDGSMRLITSPSNLSEDDLEAMGKGESCRTQLQNNIVDEIRRPIPSPILADRLKLLTWMVANGRLEVRIALREHQEFYSLFHEKIGVFSDSDGNWMTFSGSPNETVGGARQHSESFPLHRSWANEDQRAFAEEERERINAIWSSNVDGVTTWTVNEWIEQPMREHFGIREPSSSISIPKNLKQTTIPKDEQLNQLSSDSISLVPSFPIGLKLRDYQRDGINDWIKEQCRGTFAMATGTGKTITALAAATQLSQFTAQSNRPLLILVIVPSIDLVNQWCKDAEWFGFRPVVCHGNLNKTEHDALKTAFSAARSSYGSRSEMIITTAGSLSPPSTVSEEDHFLQRQLARHTGLLLVVGDEMHSLGTPQRLSSLPKNPLYTLGLSATPKRHFDETGTDALFEYFGKPVISINIKDAIYKYKCLVEYDYLPTLISLTSDEAEEYRKISARIATAYANGDEEAKEFAIRARTRLTQHAANKQVRLRELMAAGLKNKTHQIIYVAEGSHPESDQAQLLEVTQILRNEFGMRVELYYGETKPEQRQILQEKLAHGDIQALIAMKCLDEGVDIPSVRIGIITASTQNPRQFVQRRGRLLRRDPETPKSLAIIHDFIVMPPHPTSKPSDSEQTLIGNELSRAAELADAARNREVLYDIIEWAHEYYLSPTNFTWMELTDEKEMEEWVK